MPGQGARRAIELVEQVRQFEVSVLPDLARSALTMLADQLDALAAQIHALERRDDPELGAVTADGVDQHGPLTHQQLASPVQHQYSLALGALDRHEPHGRPGHRLADRLGISGVVLLPPHIGLHVARRHQAHIMTERRDLARPVVRRGARRHADQARREGLEKLQHLGAMQLLSGGDLASSIDAVDLEHGLGEINTDRGSLHGGRLLLSGLFQQRPPYGASTPETGAVHPISPTATRLWRDAVSPTQPTFTP